MKKSFALVLALVMALSLTTVAWGVDASTLDYTYVLDSDPQYIDASQSYITVSSAEELQWVMANKNAIDDYIDTTLAPSVIDGGARLSNWTIKLDADLDFSNATIAPMELGYKYLDGQNHTIKNVTVDGNGGMAGLFKWNGGTISNLTVENITVINGGGYGTGAVAGGGGNYINVTAKNIAVSGEYAVGGISGYYGYTYTNCSVIGEANTITSTTSDCPDGVGGIAGFLNTDGSDTITLTNCKVENTTINGYEEVGGIVGRAVASGTTDSIALTNCTTSKVAVTVAAEGTTYVGALIGRDYIGSRVTIDTPAVLAAKIGNTYYTTVADAITAAGANDAIVLLDANATIPDGYQVLANGTVVKTPVGGYYPIYIPTVEDTTDKDVTSAQTFDAGIALYMGVSVMGAVGTVALSKKRED